jgi:hypothetical protein
MYLTMAKRRQQTPYPERSKDVPVTHAMLYEVRDQLLEQIKAEARRTDSRFDEMNSKFNAMNSKFDAINSQFNDIHAGQHSLKSELHRLALLVEEQNSRNKIVLDGLTNIFTRQERLESEFRDLRK